MLSLDGLASFASLTVLELVLSVDNILFVALAASRLPPAKRGLGRQLGLWLALVLRIGLLCALVWVTKLEQPLFIALGRPVSVKSLVLLAGGLFLLWKGASEIHDDLDQGSRDPALSASAEAARPAGLAAVVLQIGVINIVFSLDSVITAIGMAQSLAVMVAAVAVATGLMMIAARPVGAFIESRPSAKMLGLAFILLVGVVLIADGTGFHIPRGYLYFAIAFSLAVEALNTLRSPGRLKRAQRKRARREPGPSQV